MFGDATAPHRRVGLVMLGCKASPRTQRGSVAETVHVTDLGDQDPRHGRADPVDLLDRPIAAVAAQPVIDRPLECRDLSVVDVDEIAQ